MTKQTTTKKRTTVKDLETRIDALCELVATLAIHVTESDKPTDKPEKPTDKPEKQKFSVFTDEPCTAKLYGKPAKSCDNRDWHWVGWKTQPSAKTLEAYKADGWRHSKKASNREGMYCMYKR